MLDIDGFLASTEFLTQIATIVATILMAIANQIIVALFGGASGV